MKYIYVSEHFFEVILVAVPTSELWSYLTDISIELFS